MQTSSASSGTRAAVALKSVTDRASPSAMPSLRAPAATGARMTQPSEDLRREFGDVDIYLFDQLHRGRIVEGMKVLDAGCGEGATWCILLRRGFDIWGTDVRRLRRGRGTRTGGGARALPSS